MEFEAASGRSSRVRCEKKKEISIGLVLSLRIVVAMGQLDGLDRAKGNVICRGVGKTMGGPFQLKFEGSSSFRRVMGGGKGRMSFSAFTFTSSSISLSQIPQT
jgi:hypothetical protein